MTRLLTYAQAAEALGVSPKTIARRVKAGALAVVVDGGIRRIPDAALARYVEARTIAPQERRAVSRRPSRRTAPDPGHVAGKAGSGERVRRLWEDAEQNEQM